MFPATAFSRQRQWYPHRRVIVHALSEIVILSVFSVREANVRRIVSPLKHALTILMKLS